MKMFVRGEWVTKKETIPVTNPFDGSTIDTVPRADASDVDAAIAGAVQGAALMRAMPGYERSQILRRAAAMMLARKDELGRLISMEEGKILAEGVFEVTRAAET